jgi:hypothetical protein
LFTISDAFCNVADKHVNHDLRTTALGTGPAISEELWYLIEGVDAGRDDYVQPRSADNFGNEFHIPAEPKNRQVYDGIHTLCLNREQRRPCILHQVRWHPETGIVLEDFRV